ncbi:MAG: hypothetical protein LZF60_420074 [Nitrospira sp.]|nr:MAG: hypothetical protein LZF60_420074 [Nitrospira sp.]
MAHRARRHQRSRPVDAPDAVFGSCDLYDVAGELGDQTRRNGGERAPKRPASSLAFAGVMGDMHSCGKRVHGTEIVRDSTEAGHSEQKMPRSH